MTKHRLVGGPLLRHRMQYFQDNGLHLAAALPLGGEFDLVAELILDHLLLIPIIKREVASGRDVHDDADRPNVSRAAVIRLGEDDFRRYVGATAAEGVGLLVRSENNNIGRFSLFHNSLIRQKLKFPVL